MTEQEVQEFAVALVSSYLHYRQRWFEAVDLTHAAYSDRFADPHRYNRAVKQNEKATHNWDLISDITNHLLTPTIKTAFDVELKRREKAI
ncbi:hypothetical protein [Paenibacillus sp. FSL E2-0178]|uniref:hypothetical protein n=1 Tax=Paenibacillus sp. FSL E2-0178 TaxID=2921361 RepID=UPI0031584DEF